jgi:toxin-antitoxin system PIN domain toxin
VILPDANVLIYAFRSDADHHKLCHSWLEAVVNGPAAFGIAPQVLATVVRLVTHPRVFARPTGLEETLRFCQTLLDQPNCHVVEPGPRHWEIFTSLCVTAGAAGNLVPDAWLAALAIESGCEWITFDRDFARFDGLRWSTPQ